MKASLNLSNAAVLFKKDPNCAAIF